MVDAVRNSPSTGSATVQDQRKSRVSQAETSQTSAADKASAVSSQSVSVELSVSEKVKSLSSEPPVNIEVVNEIRQKVSEGRYPIDLNAITNKLFESIKEGEG
jgi:negative regulator of flagellin synthesis FlgM